MEQVGLDLNLKDKKDIQAEGKPKKKVFREGKLTMIHGCGG